MALSFDGTNDQVSFGDITGVDGATNLTAMCWVMIDALEARGAFLSKTNGSTVSFTLAMGETNTHLACSFTTTLSASSHKSAPLAADGAWHHVAVAYNGGGSTNDDKCKLYYDGVDLGALTHDATVPTSLADSTTGTVIAAKGAAVFPDCKIAHVKMWLATLTPAQIVNEMRMRRVHHTASLILHAPFDDGVSAKDYSGAGNHGTVTEATYLDGPAIPYGAALMVL